jgi:hypothetical protein
MRFLMGAGPHGLAAHADYIHFLHGAIAKFVIPIMRRQSHVFSGMFNMATGDCRYEQRLLLASAFDVIQWAMGSEMYFCR